MKARLWARYAFNLLVVINTHTAVASFQAGAQAPASAPTQAAVKNPELRDELLHRMKTDQDARAAMMKGMKDGVPQSHADIDRMEAIDRENTQRMKEIVRTHGWPTRTMVGEDGARAAWLLVQHADKDRAFQRECLALLRKAVEAHEARGADLAYLTDRVLLAEGKPQLYGTQMVIKDGKATPQPLEDPANVDKRRAEVGLEPLADYIKRFEQRYQQPK